jgi:hypothetical protein
MIAIDYQLHVVEKIADEFRSILFKGEESAALSPESLDRQLVQ